MKSFKLYSTEFNGKREPKSDLANLEKEHG